MQYNDGFELSTCLSELDHALNDLGMLAARTNSRQQYMSEMRTKNHPYLNMVTINTRYVNNVSIGFGLQVRPVLPRVRYKPYKLPRERPRTRSENNDSDEGRCLAKQVVDTCIDNTLSEISQLKKAKSLESILLENNEDIHLKDFHIEDNSEVELVSNSIQNLSVVERY